MGKVQNGIPRWMALAIRDRFGVQSFVETGLLHGNTALWAEHQFEYIVSVEKCEGYCENFNSEYPESKVRVVNGDSGIILNEVLDDIQIPAIIWLDAHFGNDLHYQLEEDESPCPVLGEIEALNGKDSDFYILIDDAMLFTGEDGWPELNEVKRSLDNGERYIAIIDDVILAVPLKSKNDFENILVESKNLKWKENTSISETTPIDLFLPAAPKDYNKIPYAIKAACKHVVGLTSVHIITPDEIELKDEFSLPIIKHRDEDVLPFNRDEFQYRPDWVYQQFLKLFQQVTGNWYLVIDSDLVFNRNISLVEDGKPVFLLGSDQYHDPYFWFNKEMLGFGKTYPWSFLSACTFYCRYLVNEMVRFCGFDNRLEFIEKAVEIINGGCHPAESELYGSYVYSEYPDLYAFRKLRHALNGKYDSTPWSNEEIETLQKQMNKRDNVDIFTINTWL